MGEQIKKRLPDLEEITEPSDDAIFWVYDTEQLVIKDRKFGLGVFFDWVKARLYETINADLKLMTYTEETGSAVIPVGDESERDETPQAGYLRFNTDTNKYEGYDGSNWVPVGAGAVGGGSDAVFVENDNTVTEDYEMSENRNAMSTGPIDIEEGVTVTIPNGTRWVII